MMQHELIGHKPIKRNADRFLPVCVHVCTRVCRIVCKHIEALFAQECTDLSDLQCPQRQRPIHPDDQLPAEWKKWTATDRRGEKGGKERKQKLDSSRLNGHDMYIFLILFCPKQ